MNAAAGSALNPPQRKTLSRGQSIGLMVVCTLIAAVSQILIKMGASALGISLSPLMGAIRKHDLVMALSLLVRAVFAVLTNVPLVAGYGLYGIMTVLFVYALRDQELSILFPIISLSYVWVAGLSVWAFHDQLNVPRIAGIAIIIAGVFVLGKDGHK